MMQTRTIWLRAATKQIPLPLKSLHKDPAARSRQHGGLSAEESLEHYGRQKTEAVPSACK